MSDHRIGFNLARLWAADKGAQFNIVYRDGIWRALFTRNGTELGTTIVDHWDRTHALGCGDCLSLNATRRILFPED